jgi:predicted nucleic acid-binding protein
LARPAARQDVAAYRRLLSQNPHDQPLDAWRIEDAYGFNFYDCLILASAVNAGATHLLTEDLQHDQVVDGVRVVNPFLASFHDLGLT